MNHSPSDLEVILHYNSSLEPHPRVSAPAVAEAIAGFVQDGLLHESVISGSGYELTEKGRVWVEMLCETPHPEQTWVDPRIK